MRKQVTLLTGLAMVVCLSACTQAEKPDTPYPDPGINVLTSIAPDFVLGMDDQPDGALGDAYTETGFYSSQFTVDMKMNLSGWFLTYTEYGSSQPVLVCGKADCNHRNPNCNAYFEQSTYPPITPNYLWYYDGNLYVFCVQKDYYAIEKVSMDGSSRSLSCKLFRTSIETETDEDGVISTSIDYPQVVLHCGYIYFLIGNEEDEGCCLYRVKLDSSEEAELLCTQGGEYPAFYRLKAYGDYVFFQKGNYLDEDLVGLDVDLCAWDIKHETVVEVASDIVRNYTVGTDCIYYFDLENLDSVMKYDLNTKQRQLLFDSKGEAADPEDYLFEKNGKLYYSSGNEQYVFDQSGKQTETFEGDDMVLPYVPDGVK